MSLRNRHHALKCNSGEYGDDASERDVSENVNVLGSSDSSNIVEEHEPKTAFNHTKMLDGGNCDSAAIKKKLLRKMKNHSSSKSKTWLTPSWSTALRLGVSVFVIVTFVLSLSQMQTVEGQRHSQDSDREKKIPDEQIRNWAISFGQTLWETARIATRFDSLKQKFVDRGAGTTKVDGFRMVQTMAASIEAMMQHKIDAIKRIMENAEEASLGHKYDKSLGERLKMKIQDNGYHYFNAKKINVMDEDGREDESYWDKALSAIDREPNDKRNVIGYTRIKLESNKHFSGIPVNSNYSSVHVPTNVYDGDPKVVNAIKWSKMLDDIFKDNYKRDPSLSWQYFGSSTGFMRQYPAMKWRTSEHDPDLYDARMRDWYIKSAASPKEIVILLDTSGSMTGLRKEIAKHVVLNILETLSEDDFVTIYSFSKTPRPLVECFSNDVDGEERAELVQATPENLREFQEAVTKVKTEEIANFSSALTVAFRDLIDSRDLGLHTNCNQAIMLVTDGVPEREEQVFRDFNSPHKPVRVFTYLIGREISDLKAANWMACSNKGYFTHVTTLAEVKEQVLKYIPVMARPMVMFREKHPIHWTGVYADIEDPKTSRWLWDIRERSRQKRRTEHYREIMKMQQTMADPLALVGDEDDSAETKEKTEMLRRLTEPEQMENYLSYGKWDLRENDIERLQKDDEMKQRLIREITDAKTQKWTIPPRGLSLEMHEKERQGDKFTGYRLMTSVSIPVFDKKNHTTREHLGLKQSASPDLKHLKKVRIAELLGVAGTDVPISEIEKLTPPDQLGVNGYSFAVNNNGYVLYHPDLRPMFQEILKPNYNSVDLAEVELVAGQEFINEPRANDSELLEIRKHMINQMQGQSQLRVKQHFDFMKRATIRTQEYFYHQISNTPFSLGIALPRDYGRYRVNGKTEVLLETQKGLNISTKFGGDNWRIHPDWVYCEYNYAGDQHEFANPEETMKHFFNKMQQPRWNWGTTRVVPLPKCQDGKYSRDCQISHGVNQMDRESHVCNKELVQSLIFDAMVTEGFDGMSKGQRGQGGQTPDQTFFKFGIRLAFVATRSGLLRFNDHADLFAESDEKRREESGRSLEDEMIKEPHFADINNKATDETWYKRAVDYHKINPDAFVYSIPFDVGEKPTTVTATKAIVLGRGNKKAPAAVVGMQIDYDTFYNKFIETTSRLEYGGRKNRGRSQHMTPPKTCKSADLECYVIDNNGFIVVSEQKENTGKFFGEVDGTIFDGLIQHKIFSPIQIYDYQAICLEMADDGSAASIMLTPFKMAAAVFNWILGQIAWTIIRFEIHHLWNPDWTYAFPQNFDTVRDQPMEPIDAAQQLPEPMEEEEMILTGEEPDSSTTIDPLLDEFSIKDGGPIPLLQMTYINKTTPKPCDKEVTLYELNTGIFYKNKNTKGQLEPVKGILEECGMDMGCRRPFSVQMIPHTNLIMIVADTTCPCVNKVISITPTKIEYGMANETAYCDKLKYNIYRRRPKHCMSYHAEETEIKLCGRASFGASCLSPLLLILCVLLRYVFLSPSISSSGSLEYNTNARLL